MAPVLKVLAALLVLVVTLAAYTFVRDVGRVDDAESASVLAASTVAIVLLVAFIVSGG